MKNPKLLFRIFALIFGLLCSVYSNNLHAQDPVLFSQFYAAPVYLNPAFAGSTSCSRVAMNYRQLRLRAENMHTASFSYDRFSEALQGGYGIVVTSDMIDMVMMRSSIGAMYAYHLQVSRDVNVHFGAQAGYVRNDLRWNRLDFYVPEEPPDNNWTHALDLSAGVLLYSNSIYGGVALHHMNSPTMSLFADDHSVNDNGTHPGKLNMKYTVHLGLYFEPGQDRAARGQNEWELFWSPNIIYQQQGDHAHVSSGIYTGVKPVMIGIWYRHWIAIPGEADNNTLTFLAGLNMDDYRIGYSYDYSLSGFSDIRHAIHEISFALRFNCPQQRNIRSRILNYPSF